MGKHTYEDVQFQITKSPTNDKFIKGDILIGSGFLYKHFSEYVIDLEDLDILYVER